jgi:hypothetical protein
MRSALALVTLFVALAAAASASPSPAQPRTLATRAPIVALAADGDRAAIVVGAGGVCASIVVWEPTRQRVVRLHSVTRGDCIDSNYPVTRDVALAGTRAAWLTVFSGQTGAEWDLRTATLARRRPVSLAYAFSNADYASGGFVRRPFGDGGLLAFTVDLRCADYGGGDPAGAPPCPPDGKRGDVVVATVWRVAGRGRTRVAQADGELSVLAVDAGRIVVRTDSGLRLLTGTGRVLQDFPVKASAAAPSGERLAVRVAGAVEVYDTGSGELTARFPAAPGLTLEDLEGDILVTASGRRVTLRRLGYGRTITIRKRRLAHAQLERPGLFVAAGARVTFTPMRDVLRRLGGINGERRVS